MGPDQGAQRRLESALRLGDEGGVAGRECGFAGLGPDEPGVAPTTGGLQKLAEAQPSPEFPASGRAQVGLHGFIEVTLLFRGGGNLGGGVPGPTGVCTVVSGASPGGVRFEGGQD